MEVFYKGTHVVSIEVNSPVIGLVRLNEVKVSLIISRYNNYEQRVTTRIIE